MNKNDHTPEPWREGTSYAAIVADAPVPDMNGSDDFVHYGGHMVGESIVPRNRRRIIACINGCSGIPTEMFENGHFQNILKLAASVYVEKAVNLPEGTTTWLKENTTPDEHDFLMSVFEKGL